MSHSPGRWVVDRLTCKGHGGSYYWHIQNCEGDEGDLLALVPSRYGMDTDDIKSEANARLIAAAPELLVACRQAQEALKPSSSLCQLTSAQLDEISEQLIKAIAYAEGHAQEAP